VWGFIKGKKKKDIEPFVWLVKTSGRTAAGVMFSLRRNRAFLLKILLLTPLTWLCVVLYMNSSTKIIQQQQQGQGHQEQIVYVNDNKAEENLIAQEQVEIKGPPLKDNLLRKKKPTPSGFFFFLFKWLR
jgi:hypothetical protein